MPAEATTTLDISDVQAGFRGMLRRSDRSRSFFLELLISARREVRDHQRDRRGETSRWPNRARSTQISHGKGPRARLLGRLPWAWKSTASADGLLMRHMVPWSGVHDRGGVAGRGARIPRRQFSYLSAGFVGDTKSEYADYVLEGYKK